MLLKYNSFRHEFLFENLINETFTYFISDFSDILKKLSEEGEEIATELLGKESQDNTFDGTFISLGERDGYVKYNRLRDLKRNIEKQYADSELNIPDLLLRLDSGKIRKYEIESFGRELNQSTQNEVKIGRLINALLPGKFDAKEIESFTNKFKSNIPRKGEYIEEVSGEDIEYWYDSKKYAKMEGSLGNSCMAHRSNLFSIYTQNPDVCKMLILVKDGKLIGRAIVWKLNSIKQSNDHKELEPNWFLDRQYTIEDSDVEKFRNFAKEKGWYIKLKNSHSSFGGVIVDGNELYCQMTVKVEPGNYRRYPYLDTFRRYDPDSGILYNDDEESSEYSGNYLLHYTDGGYEEIEGGVWSEYLDRRIPEEEAVWSEWADSWIYTDQAVRVSMGPSRHRGWYPQDCDDIVFDETIDEYFNIDDTVYSNYMDTYIFEQNAVDTIEKIYLDGDVSVGDECWMYVDSPKIVSKSEFSHMLWFEKLSEEFEDWNDSRTHIFVNNLSKDSNDDYIPSFLEREVYPLTKPDERLGDIKYLTEADLFILGIRPRSLNYSEKRIVDLIFYNDSIRSIIPFLKNECPKKLKYYQNKAKKDSKWDVIASLIQKRYDELNTNKFIYDDIKID
jgi:hypothetical protein